MAMPEATVHKDSGAIPGQQHIGTTRHIPGMKPKAEASAMQRLPNGKFGLCVCTPDPGHHPTSRLLVYNIRQRL